MLQIETNMFKSAIKYISNYFNVSIDILALFSLLNSSTA